MLNPYGLNNIAEQRHREALEEARRYRLAVQAEAASPRAAVGRHEGLRQLTRLAAVTVRWATRVVLG